MANRRKVFVTQYNPTFTYEKAEEYGDLVFLTNDELLSDPCPKDSNLETMIVINEALSEYTPGVDYILLSGSPSVSFLVGMLLWDRSEEHLILKWSKRDKWYVVIRLPIYKIETIDTDILLGGNR